MINRFLDGFEGDVHADGYTMYNDIPNIKLVRCWAYVRCHFDKSLKAMIDKSICLSVAEMEYI